MDSAMWLYLDARSETRVTAGFSDHLARPEFFIYDREKESSLLGFIVEKLSQFQSQLSRVRGLVVVPGPGGFSTVRLVVIFANLLNFSQGLPILKMEGKDQDQKQLFDQGIKLLEQGKRTKFIVPFYSGQPNISIKKKKVARQSNLG